MAFRPAQKFFFDNSSKDLKFYTVNSSKVKDVEKYKDICEPIFLMYIKVRDAPPLCLCLCLCFPLPRATSSLPTREPHPRSPRPSCPDTSTQGNLEKEITGCDLPLLNSTLADLIQRPECDG